MSILPEKLDKTPLVDAMFELRFEPKLESAGDLLPGILYSSYEGKYSEAESLPLSNVPREIRKKNDQIKFNAHTQLTSKKNTLRIGDRAVVLSIIYPYPGWTEFSKEILELLDKLRNTSLIKSTLRFSLRYINLIEAESNHQMSLLNSKFEIAGEPASELGLQLRTEIITDNFLTILKIATNNAAKIEGFKEKKGLLIDIDTIQETSGELIWENTNKKLDACHRVLKERFFSLLLPETLESLVPTYESVRTTK